MTLRLDWCSHAAAKYAVEHWHYSRRMPSPYSKPSKIGVWENGRFIGVVVFTCGASSNLGKPYGLAHGQSCELQRIALSHHEAHVSRIIAIAIRMVRDANPGLRLIVSFADPHESHVGGIYQASNWIYSGVSAPSHRYYDRQGVQRHERNVKARAYRDAAGVVNYAKSDMVRVEHLPGKYRYLYPLDPAMRAQIAPLAKPYPKRAGSIADVPAIHAEEDGSQPIPALQEQAVA